MRTRLKCRTRSIASVLTLVLTAAIMLHCLSGCDLKRAAGAADDLMSGIKPNEVSAEVDLEMYNTEVIDFAVRLFRNCMTTDENVMISPTSVLYALAMTANGADGETLAQMEEVLGVPVHELNAYLHTYKKSLPSDEKCKLSMANSIWFKNVESFTANNDFLQLVADYYGASVYKAPFDDRTLKAINSWVKEQTDGMIENILDQIPPLVVMYLINAMAFDAEWKEIYKERQVLPGTFTAHSGAKRDAKMMCCEEYAYLDDGSATGFVKSYAGGRYAFAALLPNEDIQIDEYISALSGQRLADTLSNAQRIKVNTGIPKFESEHSLLMNDVLENMGMPDAFDRDRADLTKIGSSSIGRLYISRVIHKTFISVDERGTKAGASTIVEATPSSSPQPEESKTVYLDRPFVYMIIDLETGVPLFIGALLDL